MPRREIDISRKPVVLLADDQETPIVLARQILGEEAFEFVVARDGREAVARARAVRPDVILLDVMMPEMDGIAAAKALRADPDTAGIPIIMVTSQSELAAMERAYVHGCSDYVVKPVQGEELRAKVYSVLS